MRKAFDTPEDPYLPENILYRQKEQFSDGVGYSWIDQLRDKAEMEVTYDAWSLLCTAGYCVSNWLFLLARDSLRLFTMFCTQNSLNAADNVVATYRYSVVCVFSAVVYKTRLHLVNYWYVASLVFLVDVGISMSGR